MDITITLTDEHHTVENGFVYDSLQNAIFVTVEKAAVMLNAKLQDIVAIAENLPQELRTMTDKEVFAFYLFVDPRNAEPIPCFHQDDFLKLFHYQVVFNWKPTGKKKPAMEKAKDASFAFLLQMYYQGAFYALLALSGINATPETGLLPDALPEITVKYFDVCDRIKTRLSDSPENKIYTIALQKDYTANPTKWLETEDPTIKDFYDKWNTLTYELLTGLDDVSLLSHVPYGLGGFIVGGNYYIGSRLSDAIAVIRKHVGTKYHPVAYNNLEKLHVEGAMLALISYQTADTHFLKVLATHPAKIACSMLYTAPNEQYWRYFDIYPSMPNSL